MELREAYLLMKLMKPEGGGATVEALNVTENRTYTPDEGVDGFAPVNVNVPASAVDSGTKSINTNGTHDVVGYANAQVSVPASAVDSGTKTITENGTHDVTGYANAEVNVSGGGGGSGKAGTVIIENDVGNSYISLMTIEELGFIPHVFVLYPKNLDTSVDCVLLLGAMDGTEIDPMVYGNAMFALSRGSRTSSSYGQVWTNTGTYSSPRLKLSGGTIWAKGSFDWPLKAGEYQWYAI